MADNTKNDGKNTQAPNNDRPPKGGHDHAPPHGGVTNIYNYGGHPQGSPQAAPQVQPLFVGIPQGVPAAAHTHPEPARAHGGSLGGLLVGIGLLMFAILALVVFTMWAGGNLPKWPSAEAPAPVVVPSTTPAQDVEAAKALMQQAGAKAVSATVKTQEANNAVGKLATDLGFQVNTAAGTATPPPVVTVNATTAPPPPVLQVPVGPATQQFAAAPTLGGIPITPMSSSPVGSVMPITPSGTSLGGGSYEAYVVNAQGQPVRVN
jgi:hypothetical protein